jgi:uncharacterized membrane protein YeaQ/YmgE (transglycosylase-associated protein family)
MGILGWIVLGLIVGAVAKIITPGRDPGGIILTIVIGIVGALLGGYVGRAFFHTDLGTFFELRTWVLGLLGAVILLLIYRGVTGGRRGIFTAEEDFCAGDPWAATTG